MPTGEIRRIIDVWADETTELGRRYPWVQVFENRGEAMGASNPHPHGQIWAGDALARRGEPRGRASRPRHFEATGRPLLLDYAAPGAGRAAGRRRVPGLAGRRAVLGRLAVRDARRPDDARRAARGPRRRRRATGWPPRCQDLTRRYDALFDRPFPYSMGWHQAPFDAAADRGTGRSTPTSIRRCCAASVRKFMVGYELLAEPQRDLTPEEAAERLRAPVPRRGG